MQTPKFMQNFCQYMFDYYSKDGGKLLVHMGALGTLFGSVAQLMAVATDKKLDKDQKKFLLPQEGADAVVSVFMTYTVCDLIKKLGDKIVESGKLLTDEVADKIIKIKPDIAANINEWKKIITPDDLKKFKLSQLLKEPKLIKAFQNYDENATIIISTHLISDVENILDDVVFIQNGHIRMVDSVENIRFNQRKSVDALFREVFKC